METTECGEVVKLQALYRCDDEYIEHVKYRFEGSDMCHEELYVTACFVSDLLYNIHKIGGFDSQDVADSFIYTLDALMKIRHDVDLYGLFDTMDEEYGSDESS